MAYIIDSVTGCWVWQRYRTRDGYGTLTVAGRKVRAHRYFYEQKYGPIPEGKHLDHLCRNRACVNPDHLEPVTPDENLRRGARTRLSLAMAEEIRVLATQPNGPSQREIARRYGVHHDTVYRVVSGQRWMSEEARAAGTALS